MLDMIHTANHSLSRFSRTALLYGIDGTTALELLARGEYAIALERFGKGPRRPERDTTPLTQNEELVRMLPSPGNLANAGLNVTRPITKRPVQNVDGGG